MGRVNDILKGSKAGLMEFSAGRRLQAISPGLLQRLGYEKQEKLVADDIFEGEALAYFFDPERSSQKFQNYRAFMRASSGQLLFSNITGHRNDGRLCLLVQEIELPDELMIDSGPFVENVKAFQLVRRYVSPQIMGGIQAAMRMGRETIADESRILTYLFADLVSFTSLAEKADPAEIVEILNLSIGANSSTILHWGGYIDKIMGDSIFAVFEEPLNAIIAAVEIQKQFNILNFFRIKDNEGAIELRIGVHTGPCTIASIGTLEFMELTYIGDAVNSASRLEKAALPGSILVSDQTIAPIKDQLLLGVGMELQVKGKAEPLQAHYITGVRFQRDDGKQITIAIDDDIFG